MSPGKTFIAALGFFLSLQWAASSIYLLATGGSPLHIVGGIAMAAFFFVCARAQQVEAPPKVPIEAPLVKVPCPPHIWVSKNDDKRVFYCSKCDTIPG